MSQAQQQSMNHENLKCNKVQYNSHDTEPWAEHKEIT